MLSFLHHLGKRFLSILLTLFITTALLYATVMLTPAETRAELYMPKNFSPRMTEAQYQEMLERNIERYHLNAPYPVQYFYWITNLVQGSWGYSPTLQEDVLTAITRRAPATVEVILFSILVYLPLGLISGVIAGSKQHKFSDRSFRASAFIATSLPPFILAILMMAFFYIDLHWFAPERISSAYSIFIKSDEFRQVTGFLTIDGLLNGRPDISLDALRHLAMPVITLAVAQWAILGRITRASLVEELHLDYVTAARARGVPESRIVWTHMFRNVVSPAFSSSMISAASLLTGVFVVEIIFNYPGVSFIALRSMNNIPDAPAALGFAIFSVFMVLLLMAILDLIQYGMDPRIREKA